MDWNAPITAKGVCFMLLGWCIGTVLPMVIWELSDKWKEWRRK